MAGLSACVVWARGRRDVWVVGVGGGVGVVLCDVCVLSAGLSEGFLTGVLRNVVGVFYALQLS